MSDIKSLYAQEENEKFINDKYGKEQWVLVAGKTNINGADASFSSGLISLEHLSDVYRNVSWDIRSEYCMPGFQCDNGEDSQYFRNCAEEEGKEVLVYQRDFFDIKPDITELSEEFRLLNNLYYQESDKSYYSLKDDGMCDLAVRIDGNNVFIRLDYLMRYISAKQKALILYFDIYYTFSGGLNDNCLERFTREVKNENLYYLVSGNEICSLENKTVSRLLGKKIIGPRNKKTCGYWPFEKKRAYMDYIIGMDANGEEIIHSSDPNTLSDYFGSNPDAPHYLTPVFFQKEVLHKYLSDDKYDIRNGCLNCGYLWGLNVDLDYRDYVMVYLGDLGSRLPESEQLHWKSYNVLSDKKISESGFKKDFLNIATSPEISDIKFKNTYSAVNAKWEETFGWPLFMPLDDGDKYIINNLRIPLGNGQEEFDHQVLSLNKLIVDSLNEKKIGSEIVIKDGMRSISKLEEWLKTKGAKDYGMHISFLRDLQDLRSAGTGHRKGKEYRKIVQKLQLIGPDKKDAFEKLLSSSIDFLEFMERLSQQLTQ